MLAALYCFLFVSCIKNTGCSGEGGIVFVLLGMPWNFPLRSAMPNLNVDMAMWCSIALNTCLVGLIVQIIWRLFKRYRP